MEIESEIVIDFNSSFFHSKVGRYTLHISDPQGCIISRTSLNSKVALTVSPAETVPGNGLKSALKYNIYKKVQNVFLIKKTLKERLKKKF